VLKNLTNTCVPSDGVSIEFIDLCTQVTLHLQKKALATLKALEEVDGLGPGFFDFYAEGLLNCSSDVTFSTSYLNVLKYFGSQHAKKEVPCRPHCDPGLITVVPLNTASPGLDVWDFLEQRWKCVEIEPDSPTACPVLPFTKAIIFGGETLARLTNNYFIPCLHQVRVTKETRYSCPFQLSAHKNVVLDLRGKPSDNPVFGELADDCKEPIHVRDFMYNLTYFRSTEATVTERYNKFVKARGGLSSRQNPAEANAQ
jgi:isopenicillin N synthase-like dioxygenase